MHWHPWRTLRHLPTVVLKWQDSDHELGHFDHEADCVTLTVGMTQAERRCTLTHELVHRERGPAFDPYREIEEAIVEDLSARRLIPLDALLDAMVWTSDEYELADILWVDRKTLVCRLRNLSAAETRFISDELDRRELTFHEPD